MNYDTWKAHDPMDDEDYRMPECQTKDCENRVTFEHEVFCSACLADREWERRQRTIAEEHSLQENLVRR